MKKNIFIILLLVTSCSFLGRPPTDVILLMPENQATWQQANVQLIWQSENADMFSLYFGETADSLELLAEQTGSSYELMGLTPRSTYYWKVKAKNEVAEKESQTYSFSTGTKPDPVTDLHLPDTNLVILEPNVPVTWAIAAYADSYYVEISFDTMFLNLFLGQMFEDTFCVHSDFYPNKKYYWRVQSWNSFGCADWSEVGWFYISEYVPKKSSE